MRPLKENKSIRINFYMQEDLVKDIDNYANSLGITRSAAISVLCSNQLAGLNSMENIGAFAEMMKQLGANVALKDKG